MSNIEDNKQQQQQNTINGNGNIESPPCYSTTDIDINFLPQIYDITRCLDKESQEIAQPKSMIPIINRDQTSSDCGTKILKLRESFDNFRQQIVHVPGSSFTIDEQLQTLCSLRQQLIMKKELLLKYKDSKLMDAINFSHPSQLLSTSSSSNTTTST